MPLLYKMKNVCKALIFITKSQQNTKMTVFKY
jgi:hypothetical protein